MDRTAVLHTASVGGRALNGFGDCSTPDPGAVADLILVEENPMSSLDTLKEPVVLITHGRLVSGR